MTAKTNNALNLVLNYPPVKVVFLNVLGGITRADDVARGVTANPNQLLYIALSWGFSLAVNLWMFSGGLFNPAVSFLTLSPFYIAAGQSNK